MGKAHKRATRKLSKMEVDRSDGPAAAALTTAAMDTSEGPPAAPRSTTASRPLGIAVR